MKNKTLVTSLIIIVIALTTVVGFLAGFLFTTPSEQVTPTKTKTALTDTVTAKTTEKATETATATQTSKPGTFTVYVTALEGLNLRNKATTSDTVQAVMPYGTAIEVDDQTTADNRDWYHGTYQEKTGWFAKEFTAKENPFTTYENTEIGYTFDYPKDWTIENNKADKPSYDWRLSIKGTTAAEPYFDSWVNPSGFGFEEYSESVSEKSVVVGGVSTTKKVLRNPETNVIAVLVQFTYKSNNFLILYTYSKAKELTEQTIFDTIISSWSFTK